MEKQQQAGKNETRTYLLHAHKGFLIDEDAAKYQKQRSQLNHCLAGLGVDKVEGQGKKVIVTAQSQRSDKHQPPHSYRCTKEIREILSGCKPEENYQHRNKKPVPDDGAGIHHGEQLFNSHRQHSPESGRGQ